MRCAYARNRLVLECVRCMLNIGCCSQAFRKASASIPVVTQVCELEFTGKAQLGEHNKGRKHREKVAALPVAATKCPNV